MKAVISLVLFSLKHFNPAGGYDVPGLFQVSTAIDFGSDRGVEWAFPC
jgi:hypothetical protein